MTCIRKPFGIHVRFFEFLFFTTRITTTPSDAEPSGYCKGFIEFNEALNGALADTIPLRTEGISLFHYVVRSLRSKGSRARERLKYQVFHPALFSSKSHKTFEDFVEASSAYYFPLKILAWRGH